MRILRIIYDWPPPWQGLAPHPYELTKAQISLGHTVDVFCGRWPNAGSKEAPEGVTIHSFIREPLPGTISLTSSVFLFFSFLFWKGKKDISVIHSHGHFGIWIYLYRLFLKRFFKNATLLKIPLIAHFHNTTEGRWQATLEKGGSIKLISKYFAWPLSRLADKWAIQAADAYIFVSEAVKEEAVKYYEADPKKCFVVESGVNPQIFTPIGVEEREKTRRELGLDLYDKVILNHGMLVERKNVHLLVEALKFLPADYKLLLVGPGDLDYIERIEESIKNLKLVNRVIRIGYTPYPQVPIAFQASDIFVLPSTWEGVPKVVLQSLACGVPALVSGFKLNGEIGGLSYLENLDPAHIAKYIKQIVESTPMVDINKVRWEYSWKKKASEVEKVYEFINQTTQS